MIYICGMFNFVIRKKGEVMKNNRILLFILALVFVLTIFALPVFAAEERNPYEYTQAASFDEKKVANVANFTNSANDNGESYIEYLSAGDYFVYKGFDFGESPSEIEISLAAGGSAFASSIVVRLDSPTSPIIATVKYDPKSDDWYHPEKYKGDISEPISGTHDVYICINEACNLFGFSFKKQEGASGANLAYSDVIGTEYERTASILSQLGIIEKGYGKEYGINVRVNREEFAISLMKILTKDDYKASARQVFDDVPPGNKGFNAVAYLYDHKVINGVGNNMFEPKHFITPDEAVIMTCRALGYGKFATDAIEYKVIATRLGLLNGVDVSDNTFKRGDMLKVLLNIIESEYLSYENFSKTAEGTIYAEYVSEKGILSYTHGINKAKGIVTGTSETSLYTPESSLISSVVMIDDVMFNIGSTNAADFLGFKCEYFYTENKGEYTLVAIEPCSSTKILTVDTSSGDEIESITSNNLVYYDVNGKKKEVKFKNPNIIYNHKALDFELDDYFESLEYTGKIVCVDNGDGYESVILENYRNIMVSDIDTANAVIYDGFSGQAIELKNDALTIIKDGELIQWSDINIGDCGVIYFSLNASGEKFGNFSIISEYKTGRVSSIGSDGYVYIDDMKYTLANESNVELYVGLDANFYINQFGEILKYSTSGFGNIKVGCMLGFGITKGFDRHVQIQVLTTDSKIEVFDCDSTVLLDGNKTSDPDYIKAELDKAGRKSPVRYKVNSKNEIVMLDTAEEKTNDKNDSINLLPISTTQYYIKGNKMLLDGSNGRNAYPISNNAYLFSVPENVKEEKYYTVDMNAYGSPNGSVLWEVYSFDNDSDFVNAIIVDNIGVAGNYVDGMVFNEVIQCLDPEEPSEIDYYLTGYKGANYVEYRIDDSLVNNVSEFSKIMALEKGDYVLPYMIGGLMTNIEYSYFWNETHSHTYDDNGVETEFLSLINLTNSSQGEIRQSYRKLAGVVKEFGKENPDFIKLRLIDDSNNEYINVATSSITVVKESDRGTELSFGEPANSIRVGDTVFVWISNTSMKHVVVYK